MIAVFVNSMADTATFAPLFKDIEGISLYNPTREELEKVLAENPTETFMCLGHGSPRGLFSADMHGFLLDREVSSPICSSVMLKRFLAIDLGHRPMNLFLNKTNTLHQK